MESLSFFGGSLSLAAGTATLLNELSATFAFALFLALTFGLAFLQTFGDSATDSRDDDFYGSRRVVVSRDDVVTLEGSLLVSTIAKTGIPRR